MVYDLTTEEKVVKAKIEIQLTKPFFAYLLLNTHIKETKIVTQTLGVSPRGTIYYNPVFIESLTQQEIVGCLCHEVMHLALVHLIRIGSRHPKKWNIATDLVINSLLIKDIEAYESKNSQRSNMQLPKCGLIPVKDGEFTVNNVFFKKLYEMSAEEVYDKIPDTPGKGKSKKGKGQGDSEGDSDDDGDDGDGDSNFQSKGKGKGNVDMNKEGNHGGFDDHIYANGEKEKSLSTKEKRKLERKWKKAFTEAASYAQQRGTLPGGMDRMLDKLLKPKINWKLLILKNVSSVIPTDFTWRTPHRKSIGANIYLPSTIRESVEVTVAPDLSGSVYKDYKRFMSEILGLSKTYRQIKMNVIMWDTRVVKDIIVSDNTAEMILKQKVSEAWGGTQFSCVAEHLEEKKKRPKMIVVFTDGYIENDPILPPAERILWVITPNGDTSIVDELPGKVIKMTSEECDDDEL